MIAENNPLSTANEIIRLTKSGYYIKQALDKIGINPHKLMALMSTQRHLSNYLNDKFPEYLESIKDVKEEFENCCKTANEIKEKTVRKTAKVAKE